jgi:hypothetical protein
MALPLPLVVGVGWDSKRDPVPGVLLEWKQHPDKRENKSWYGLVMSARQSLASAATPFTVTLEWVPRQYIVPLPDHLVLGRNPQAQEAITGTSSS